MRHHVRRIRRLAGEFIALESSSGLLLIGAAAIALAWANSPLQDSYASFLHQSLAIPALGIDLDVHGWVNDALMALFFLVVGLEIKREVVEGELRDRRTATLPVAAAIGGMVVPALIYIVITAGSDASNGWGIPMATDIAFAVGVVALLGPRVPASLKLFLLSLAVVDDLGAIAVIAIVYTSSIAIGWLLGAVGAALMLVVFRLLGVRIVTPYLLVGVVVWYCMLRSGVHATVAGVLVGFLLPLAPVRPGDPSMSHLVERRLLPWSAYVVVPLFALCNAGVVLGGDALREAFGSSLTWGVIVGLVGGKTIGVLLGAAIAILLGLAVRPRGATNIHLTGIAMSAGIGFTVSLFVSGLAFDDPMLVDQARIGILFASLVAAIGALLLLRTAASRASIEELAIEAREDAELFAETDEPID